MNILTLITTLAFAILTTALQPCAPRYAQRCNGINEIEVCEQLFTGLYWVHGAWCVTGHICVDPRGDPQCVPAFNYCRPFYPKGEVEKIMEEVEASREQSQTQSQSLEIEAGEAADAVGEESGEVAGADEAGVADSAVAITAMNADTTDGAEDDATADSITNVDTTDAIAPSTLATVAAPTSEKRSDQSCYRLGEQRCYGWAEIQVCTAVNGGLYWRHGAECDDLYVCVKAPMGEPRCEPYLADCWPWCSQEEKVAAQAAKNEELATEAAAAE